MSEYGFNSAVPGPVPNTRKGFASNCRGLGFCLLLKDFSHFNKCLNKNVRNELSKRIIIFASDLTSFKQKGCIKTVEILK